MNTNQNDPGFRNNFNGFEGTVIFQEGNIFQGVGKTDGDWKHGSMGIEHAPSGLQLVVAEVFDNNGVWESAFIRVGLKDGAQIMVKSDGTIMLGNIPSYADENTAHDDLNLSYNAVYRVGGDLKIKV